LVTTNASVKRLDAENYSVRDSAVYFLRTRLFILPPSNQTVFRRKMRFYRRLRNRAFRPNNKHLSAVFVSLKDFKQKVNNK